jgi:hypothetical protein
MEAMQLPREEHFQIVPQQWQRIHHTRRTLLKDRPELLAEVFGERQ